MPVVRFTGTRMTPDEEMVLRLRHGRYLPPRTTAATTSPRMAANAFQRTARHRAAVADAGPCPARAAHPVAVSDADRASAPDRAAAARPSASGDAARGHACAAVAAGAPRWVGQHATALSRCALSIDRPAPPYRRVGRVSVGRPCSSSISIRASP